RRVERAATDFTAADKQLASYTRTPAQWLRILTPASLTGRRLVERTYGVGGPLIAERIRDLRKVVRLFARTHGRDRRCFLVRAPGRVNLMGRHVDHQGGHVHAMALDREVVMAVAPRKDGVIRLVNTEPVAFPFRELLLGDWRPTVAAVNDWLAFVDGEAVRAHLASTAGDWSNYVLAVAIYQQYRLPNRRLRGMDVAVHGNVPMAAGLSSSSSMVVASMEAVAAVNGIRAPASDLVNWCGEAEWFVGSRGGSSDQAAIRLARAGFAARMEFHPFRVSQYVPIPERAAVLIAYSGEHAVKSAGARDRFNERVANYRLGLLLLKKRHPRLASRLEYVRDLLPTALGVDAGRTFALLGDLPERITRRQIQRELGAGYADLVERIFSSHEDPGEYTIREVVAFGVGECERSRIAAAQLEQGDLEAFGELMQLSHDGDRVSGKLAGPLVAASGGIHSNGMPLHHLVGKYACSTKNIDRLVDIARAVPGVYGAQLAGAGLGGCVMVLAQRDAATRVRKALTDAYYRPREMTPAVWQVRSVAGGGLIRP
ncbi:MAG: hypothetical protein JXA69_17800, partial [Phycisphaerae bacterium]|nr:hypothetical protein [Phycisphaerae bacterium]